MSYDGEKENIAEILEKVFDKFEKELNEMSPEEKGSEFEYGKYMVQESGDYYYDAGLEGYIDYERLGQSLLFKEIGQFVESGYISYKGTLTLEELMMGDSVEQYRAEQGPLMGGM